MKYDKSLTFKQARDLWYDKHITDQGRAVKYYSGGLFDGYIITILAILMGTFLTLLIIGLSK